ncbi:2-hydroxyacid dehydrogenase [Halalkalibacter oceani]|uniref:2-hydroxyacid dehydrogenase n=1 Tax=Halalkalibacter oceani TaxID=1653776 RepID=UPI00339B65B7
MKPRVFVDKPIAADIENFIREHCEVEKWEDAHKQGRQELLAKLEKADGLLTTAGREIDPELLDHAANLKVISNMSVGYNNFNIAEMKARNIIGTHTPFVLDDTVADLVFALILSTARRVPELDTFVREGKWGKVPERAIFGVDVHHTTLGIIGMGRIGAAIAKRAKRGFDMNVKYYSRTPKPDVEQSLGIDYLDLDTLLQESDYVVLMTPLTKETEHLIGEEQFKLMKSSAIFINASRGGTVDERALIKALQTGEIRAAGLDVFAEEPINEDNPLLQLKNAVLLPHIGSATAKTRYDMAMLAAQDLVRALTGEQPKHIVKELQTP